MIIKIFFNFDPNQKSLNNLNQCAAKSGNLGLNSVFNTPFPELIAIQSK